MVHYVPVKRVIALFCCLTVVLHSQCAGLCGLDGVCVWIHIPQRAVSSLCVKLTCHCYDTSDYTVTTMKLFHKY